MLFRISICLAAGLLTACSTARMERLPTLQADAVSHKITEMSHTFSNGELAFGPYRVSAISRGWIKGKVSGWRVGKLKYETGSKAQDYSFRFLGHKSWEAECRSSKGQQRVSAVSYGIYVDLSCGIVALEAGTTAWEFSFKGNGVAEATGRIDFGQKEIFVKPVSTVEGSPLKLGFYTGYYFYLDNSIVAAVDTVSKEGPIWFKNSLSEDERDRIGIVAVALLLNQVVFDS